MVSAVSGVNLRGYAALPRLFDLRQVEALSTRVMTVARACFERLMAVLRHVADLIGRVVAWTTGPIEAEATLFDEPVEVERTLEGRYRRALFERRNAAVSVDNREVVALNALQEVEGEQVIALIMQCIDRFPSLLDDFLRYEFVQGIVRIPSTQREDVIRRAQPFIPNGSQASLQPDGNQIRAMIEAIARIPMEEREDVLAGAHSFIDQTMVAYEKSQLIGAVGRISVEERGDVLRRAHTFAQEHRIEARERSLTARMYASLVDAIAQVPRDQREDVIHRASLLLGDEREGFTCLWTISAVASVLENERDDVIHRASLLLGDEREGLTCLWTISAVDCVPVGERDDVIQRALVPVPMGGDVGARNTIIRALGGISQEERAGVIAQANSLMNVAMDDGDRSGIIASVARVPSSQREEFMQCIREQIANLTQIDEITDRIDTLSFEFMQR